MVRELKRDAKTPASVAIRGYAREPVSDPRLGIALPAPEGPPARQRLVTIGDSLTHGFQSGAIHRTELSFPRLIARELGWEREFRFPTYPEKGGLPFNIEFAVRELEAAFPEHVQWWELPTAALRLRTLMDEIEDAWEGGVSRRPAAQPGLMHNLGVYGWDLRDVLSRTNTSCAAAITPRKDNLLHQIVQHHNERAALRVLPAVETHPGFGVLDAARELGKDGGIETLIVMLGSNNALRTVVDLEVHWSQDGYDHLDWKKGFTVWDPVHFKAELELLTARVREITAQHVIFGTVPHVTIAPFARGIGPKVAPQSRYFPYYTRTWIEDDDFDPTEDPHITEAEARAIDSAIDQYNDAIVDAVRQARQEGRDWYVYDVAGLLDRLAQRRYIDSPEARPPWWTPYDLPGSLARLNPVPNSRFFRSDATGRTAGGLFSLDGVHPTTIGYGILAEELIKVMETAGVKFYDRNGALRPSPVRIDFERLLVEDTLMCRPPRSLSGGFSWLGWLDEAADALAGAARTLT
jgi:hypothetical protein